MEPDRELRRICHIEDDADIREIALMALETIGGFEVAQCSSGSEALAVAPAMGPDMLLIDVMMPGMDGKATLAGLRRYPQLAAVPAVFMTARAQEEEVAELMALGAAGVVTKPFDPATLADELRAIWARHRAEAA